MLSPIVEGFLPYYPQSFFQTIKQVHEETPLNVKTMTTSQWARVLTENGLTMEQVPNQETMQYIPCRSELSAPDNDWQLSWNMCRTRGFNSDMISFNFKFLHRLLPVRDRLHQITPATSPLCTLCNNSCPETLQHALLTCQYNAGTGQALISSIQTLLPAMSADKLLLLQFPSLSESQEMSAVFLTAALLLEVWTKRSKKIRITLYDIRSALEARCSLLRETRFHNMHETLKELIESL